MKKIENVFEKLTKRNLLAITSVIYLAIILLYELFYCNYEFFFKIIPSYNFSIYRIIAYTVIYLLVYKFKDKFIDSALETFKLKAKCRFLMVIMFISVAIILAIIILSITNYFSIYFVNLLISILLILLFAIYISNNMIKNIIIIALTFGIIFSISITFNNQLDEKRHFLASYSIALGEFNLTDPAMDKSVSEMPRMMSVENFVKYYTINPTNNIVKEPIEDISDSPNDYLTVSYIISGAGIFIAKTLGGSIADIYITGRIFNLLGYIVFAILALRVLPYKKNIMFSIFCMPMLLALASVYSVDGIGTALMALFIAYCLNLCEKDNIGKSEILILLMLMILACTIKSAGYIGIALILFILPLKKIIKANKKYLKYMVIFLIILITIIIFTYTPEIEKKGDPRGGDVNVSLQLEYIMDNPFEYLKLFAKYTKFTFTNLLSLSFLNAPMFFNLTYMGVFLIMSAYLLFVSITDSSKQLKLKTRIVFIVTFFLTFAMVSTVMYLAFTEVGANYINGYQMRYFFPILFLLLSSISIKRFNLDYNKFKFMNLYTCCISSIFLILSAFDAIL